MNLQQLKYFVSVAESLNFTEAAQRNYISQPAISKQIRELESYYGSPLFVRTKHDVKLTLAGKELFQYAREMLMLETEIKNRMDYLARGRSGQIRIAFLGGERAVVAECIARFSRRYPQIQLSINQFPGKGMLEALQERSFDFYFALNASFDSVNGYTYLQTQTPGLSVLYPKCWEDEIDPNDLGSLTGKPFSYFSREFGYFLYDHTFSACQRRGYTPAIMTYYNSAEAVALAVEAGIGLTILPTTICRDYISDKVGMKEIPGEDTHIISSVGWPDGQENSASLYFKQVIKELYGK